MRGLKVKPEIPNLEGKILVGLWIPSFVILVACMLWIYVGICVLVSWCSCLM